MSSRLPLGIKKLTPFFLKAPNLANQNLMRLGLTGGLEPRVNNLALSLKKILTSFTETRMMMHPRPTKRTKRHQPLLGPFPKPTTMMCCHTTLPFLLILLLPRSWKTARLTTAPAIRSVVREASEGDEENEESVESVENAVVVVGGTAMKEVIILAPGGVARVENAGREDEVEAQQHVGPRMGIGDDHLRTGIGAHPLPQTDHHHLLLLQMEHRKNTTLDNLVRYLPPHSLLPVLQDNGMISRLLNEPKSSRLCRGINTSDINKMGTVIIILADMYLLQRTACFHQPSTPDNNHYKPNS